jgi:hypothetical protein
MTNFITDDLINANAKAQFYNTTPATADGSLRVLFDTTEFNDNDIFVLDTVNREVVCNFNGIVQVNVDLSASSGTLVSARISLNNSAEYATGISNSGGSRATSSAMVPVSSGDRISVKDSGVKLDIARVSEYSAGEPAGFGLATETKAGLLPPVSIMSDTLATELGQKMYINGENGLSITGSNNFSIGNNWLIPKKLTNGKWFLSFGISFDFDEAVSLASVTISGIDPDGDWQYVAVSTLSDGSNFTRWSRISSSNTFEFQMGAGVTGGSLAQGNILLTSKPTWAY